MKKIIVYSSAVCPYCDKAKRLLEKKGVNYEVKRIDSDPALREEMLKLSGRKTVPQIFIGDFHVGGCDDLYALEQAGKLDGML